MMRLSERTNRTAAPHKREMTSGAVAGSKQIERPFTKGDFDETFFQARYAINAQIERFFPDELLNFKKPSWHRIHKAYTQKDIGWLAATVGRDYFFGRGLSARQSKALLAIALVRYVDDFIDTALWPNIRKHDKVELATNFRAFLQEVLSVARQYEPSMPEEIIELPQLELDLELNPSQENFDRSIIRFLERKAFDMKYVESLDEDRNLTDAFEGDEELKYQGMCAYDIARDFSSPEFDFRSTKDFHLREFVVKHKIDPLVLITYLQNLELRLAAHQGSKVFPKAAAEKDEEACADMISDLQEIREHYAIIK